MHGRESYCAGGRRHIQGAYLDQDSHMVFFLIHVNKMHLAHECVHKFPARVCMYVYMYVRNVRMYVRTQNVVGG